MNKQAQLVLVCIAIGACLVGLLGALFPEQQTQAQVDPASLTWPLSTEGQIQNDIANTLRSMEKKASGIGRAVAFIDTGERTDKGSRKYVVLYESGIMAYQYHPLWGAEN